MPFTQGFVTLELVHWSWYTGVVAQELLHRSCYAGVATQQLLHRSCYTGVCTLHHKFLYLSLLAAGAARPHLSKRGPLRRSCLLDAQTRGGMRIGRLPDQPSVEMVVRAGRPNDLWRNGNLSCAGATLCGDGACPKPKRVQNRNLKCQMQSMSKGKNWGKIAIAQCQTMQMSKNCWNICNCNFETPGDENICKPCAWNEGRTWKSSVKFGISDNKRNPFAQNDGRTSKIEVTLRFFTTSNATFFAWKHGRTSNIDV